MIDFCPDGYLPLLQAVATAARHWFAERFTELENATPSQQATESESPIEKAVRIFSQPPIPDDWRQAFDEIKNQSVHRLRNLLHQGTLHAYYFESDGRHLVSRDFWATAEADGTLKSGIYWPFGRPARLYESRPNYSLFLLQSELGALLSDQRPEKRSFPQAKMPDLVAALRRLDDLSNREKQREALRKLPEFEQYHLTDGILREAEKQVPRKPGRKPSPSEQ